MHLVRLGVAKEEPLIRKAISSDDILVFKANLVAYMKDGLSAFLYSWNPHNPGYVIDPFLYAVKRHLIQPGCVKQFTHLESRLPHHSMLSIEGNRWSPSIRSDCVTE